MIDRRGAALVLLSFTAGTMDAIAFMALGNVFASAMSGNTMKSPINATATAMTNPRTQAGSVRASARIAAREIGKGSRVDAPAALMPVSGSAVTVASLNGFWTNTGAH